ncbi:hypothetical protein [Paenibacillus sp. UMB4589-SE434]|uniref:hypothetical protein n=1 Tax=Paenibacillus sp. UMB4589-SE434 TaxID=3046314 RepID=UPI00254E5121|nr:hypothetical protein [Paenibacillus sp. UMB4589-SE434]MDK8182099.1 hypothetical protein [Paenibacillus sp. UMB4589-SE434]
MIDLGLNIGGQFSEIILKMFKLLLMYMFLPLFVLAIALKVLRVRGHAFSIVMGVAGLCCLYYFGTHGILDMSQN